MTRSNRRRIRIRTGTGLDTVGRRSVERVEMACGCVDALSKGRENSSPA